jgi:hypothetical protein
LMDGSPGECLPDCTTNADCVSNTCDTANGFCWYAGGL